MWNDARQYTFRATRYKVRRLVTLLVFLIARDLNVRWVQKVSLVCLGIMFWAILYLGEHYLIDAVASAILYPVIYFAMTRRVFPDTSDGEKEERSAGKATIQNADDADVAD